MGLVLTTDAVTEPVSLVEAKAHMRITSADDNTYITALIKAARKYAENMLQAAFIDQTWTLTMDGFYDSFYTHPRHTDRILLMPVPLKLITSIKYYDSLNAQQTLAADQYTKVITDKPGSVEPAPNCSWPTTYDRREAVEIVFTAGWASAAVVPEDVKQGLMILVAHFYENRELMMQAQWEKVPLSAQVFLAPYGLMRVL